MALDKRPVPISLVGGIDTKTAPQIVPPGSFLELENVFRSRTGELIKRYGSAVLSTPGATVIGGEAMLAKWKNLLVDMMPGPAAADPHWRWLYTPAFAANFNGWSQPRGQKRSDPFLPRTMTGPTWAGSGPNDNHQSADACIGGGAILSACETNGTSNVVTFAMTDAATGGAVIDGSGAGNAVRPKTVAVGNYLCVFCVDVSVSPRNLKVVVWNMSSFTFAGTTYTPASGTVVASGSEPFYDVYVPPGASTVLVAYRNSTGGVTAIEFNPASGTNVQSASFAADVTQCLGWVVDDVGTAYSSARYLACAGGTNGVQEKVLATNLTVSATNTIDGTATANVRNITGHVSPAGSSTRYFHWEVSAAATHNHLVRTGRWNGSASVLWDYRGVGLASKPIASSGKYFLLTAYDSPTQAQYLAIEVNTNSGAVSFAAPILYGRGGGVTARAGHLPNVSRSASSPYQVVTAVLRKTKMTADNGDFFSVKSAVPLEVLTNTSQLGIPRDVGTGREIGDALYVPGGQVAEFDGRTCAEPQPPVAPERPALTAGSGGSLTASTTYRYVSTFKWIDANGRVHRSAPSEVAEVALTGGQNRITVDATALRVGAILAATSVVVEYWRTEGDGTVYYLAGEVLNSANVDTVQLVDNMSDATLGTKELLYTSGGVLPNFNAPAVTVLEAYGNRLWGVNSETRNEIWYSKELKAGVGVSWHPRQIVVTDAKDGDVYAMGVVSERLVFLKRTAIYGLAGEGPTDLGQGGYDKPTLVTDQQGTTNPRSVVQTPEGLMFEGSKGIWLLGLGGELSYIGAPVEGYFTGGGRDITAAVHLSDRSQVRFFTAGGRTLVWDYLQRQWYTFTGQAASSAVAIGSTLYWVHPTTGVISYETPGSYGDNGVGYAQLVTLPHLALAGMRGFQRIYVAQLQGEAVGVHTVAVDVVFDYGVGSPPAAPSIAKTLASSAAWPQGEVPIETKCSAAKITIRESAANTAGGFKLVGLTLEVGIKRGMGRIPPTSRFA